MTRPFIVHPSSFIVLVALACGREAVAPQTKTPSRLITLAPNITELVTAVGGGAKIVGTDNFSNVANAAKVGGVEPDIEKIVSLEPDLVIASASAAHPNLRGALAAVHVPLLVIKTERLADITRAASEIARAIGTDAQLMNTHFDDAIERSRRTRAKQPRVLFTVWTDPMYVAGRATFIDDLYGLAGATNAADVTGWPQYSLESFVAHPPDILLYPDHSVTKEAVAALLDRAKVKMLVAAVDEDSFTHPGPRLADALIEINRVCDEWERAH